MRAIDFFTPTQRDQIRDAIKKAEENTSGEIRVHLENHVRIDPLDRAATVFEELQMERTRDRNGVLVYVAVQDHKYAIIGDCGIHDKVGNAFWNKTSDILQSAFKRDDFYGGLIQAIEDVGMRIKEHFPIRPDDKNELKNEISDDISLNEN